ncbi:MAG: hypothetical protein QNL62_20850 [Gammaproteobacteria bacterium]|nr:hypothetical protein [Gammaproteobacteria bacterium]
MKGFITGIAVAGFGAGAFLFVKLEGTWGNLIADYGVSYTFMTFGLIFMIAGGIGALFLSIPPEG